MTMHYVAFYDREADRTGFVLDCEHASTNLMLEGNREGDQAEVLGNLIEQHRTAVIAGNEVLKEGEEPLLCLCRPEGWVRGEPLLVQ